MQIKIGFKHNSRELNITTEKGQEEVVNQLQQFLGSQDDTTVVEGAKGARFLLVRDQVAYVEFGAENKTSVGFI
ncbi:DUF3107 domain-containing protein [Corynebacterium sp. HMSC28B08]|uniref:DUF3107 domain-containing protein n=1 Tax=Corynebacterium TaxID=1716 RepID=UPI0008CE7D6E|nr:DUF3107 domain-containing protein [Corynebacterium sp. HMSC28B08]OFT89997.1 ATP-binding protein [Corynebacterium sp. HMSC28B08]